MTKAKTHTPDEHNHDDHDHAEHDHTGHNHTHDHAADAAAQAAQSQLPIAPNSQLIITLPWATVEPAYQKALRRYARDLKVDGFRKGKVPAHMVEGLVNQSAIVEYVLQLALPDAYTEAIKAADKHPLTQPEIDPIKIEKGSDWEVIVFFAEAPEVKLGKYAASVKTAKKDAAKEITEREAELVKKAAEKKTDEADEKEEKAVEAPTTLTDAEKDEISTRYIFKKLVEDIAPKVPELLVRREADRELRRLLEQLEQLKLSVENYLQSRGMTAEQLRLEYLSAAAASLQIEFILAEVGREQKIVVEETEVDEQLTKIFGEKMTDEQRQNSEYRSYVFSSLVKQKIVKYLLSL